MRRPLKLERIWTKISVASIFQGPHVIVAAAVILTVSAIAIIAFQ